MSLNLNQANLYKQRSAAERSKQKQLADGRQNSVTNPDVSMNGQVDQKQQTNENDYDAAFKRLGLDDKPLMTFDQLHGCDEARKQILRIIGFFKKDLDRGSANPKICRRPIPICGSKGLGKTSLVEAAANHVNLKLIRIPIAEILKLAKYSRNRFMDLVNHLIQHSIVNSPALVLFDKLDSVADKDDYRAPIQDFIEDLLGRNMLVFCAASAKGLAILGDMELSSAIQIQRPNQKTRFNILKSLRTNYQDLSNLTDDELQVLAMKTPSFTPADLDWMLCTSIEEAQDTATGVPELEHYERAIERVKKSFKGKTYLIGEKPSTTWADIGGLSSVRQEVQNILRRDKHGNVKCKFSGTALYGPPGCGKTLVAKAMANEAGFNFISIRASELVNKYLGETEKNIRQVFAEAREYEPCIIYFDEFDGLFQRRDQKEQMTNAVQTLLSEMDGFTDRGQSIVVISTNCPDDIDKAIMRPGRISRHIYVGPPDEKARRNILDLVLRGISLAGDVDLDDLARRTDNFTGADLHMVIGEAIQMAENSLDNNSEHIVLSRKHLEHGLKKISEMNREIATRIKPRNKRSRPIKRQKIK